MAIGPVFYKVMIHILQLLLYSLAGAYLTWFKAFDPVGENRAAEANLHVFVPFFCFVTFSKAVDPMSHDSLGLLFFTFIISSAFCIFFAIIYCRLAKVDVRIQKVFVLLAAFGDVAFLPSTLLKGLCDEDGALAGDPNCKYTVPYSFYVLFLFNVALIIIGPFCMHRDKAIDYNVRRQMIMVREYYKSPKEFLDDTNLAAVDKALLEHATPAIEAAPGIKVVIEPTSPLVPLDNVPGEKVVTSTHLFGKEDNGSHREIFDNLKDSKVPMTVVEQPDMVSYAMELHLDRDVYDQWQSQFNKFLDKLSPNVFNTLIAKVPPPEKSPQLGWHFLLEKARSEVIDCCILGMIIGRIPKAFDWLYGEDGMEYFMGVVEGLAGLALPLAIMVWGVELYHGFHFRGRNIRIPDVVAMILIHLVIVPSIGLGFVHGLSNDGIEALDNDRVLMFSMYANWCVSPGLLLLTLFILCGYYMKEGALMMFWCAIAEIPLAPLFTYAYLEMMDIKA